MIESFADWARERRIENLKKKLAAQPTGMEARRTFAALRNEINNRSPEQVARLERRRGLGR